MYSKHRPISFTFLFNIFLSNRGASYLRVRLMHSQKIIIRLYLNYIGIFENVIPRISVPFDVPPRISGIFGKGLAFGKFNNFGLSGKFPWKFLYDLFPCRNFQSFWRGQNAPYFQGFFVKNNSWSSSDLCGMCHFKFLFCLFYFNLPGQGCSKDG